MLLIGVLRVPALGPPLMIVGILLLLLGCALGIGFVISLLAPSEQQAAQLAMLVLIASVFFSGFMIYLEAIEWPYRVISYLLPATYAIRSLRDAMLRGFLSTPADLIALTVVAVTFFSLTILLFRREFRPR